MIQFGVSQPTKYCVISVRQENLFNMEIKITFGNSWLWLHHGPQGFSILATFLFSVFPRTFPVQLTFPVAAFGYHSLLKALHHVCYFSMDVALLPSCFLFRYGLRSKSTDRICSCVWIDSFQSTANKVSEMILKLATTSQMIPHSFQSWGKLNDNWFHSILRSTWCHIFFTICFL